MNILALVCVLHSFWFERDSTRFANVDDKFLVFASAPVVWKQVITHFDADGDMLFLSTQQSRVSSHYWLDLDEFAHFFPIHVCIVAADNISLCDLSKSRGP